MKARRKAGGWGPLRGARPTGGAGDSAPLLLADRYYSAFNARDLNAWLDTLAEDVEILVDAGVLRGRVAALAYLNGILQAYPGVVVASRRVVAVSGDAVVSEFQLLNPTATAAAPAQPAAPWRLDGVTCEVLRLRGGRLSSLHSYYSPAATDRTPTAEVPSRAEAARIAHRQAALGRVAAQVAGGGSEGDLVAVVNQVIADFAGVDASLIMRFETGDTAVVLAASGLVDDPAAVGRRLVLADGILAVRNGGRVLRFGAHGWPLREATGDLAGREDLQWCVGVPIMLHGAVWGLSLLGSVHDEPFADDIEDGIAGFTQLVSTALANARANDELRERAREQSELLEVAETAAGGADTSQVFAAITRSASAVLEGAPTTLIRFLDADAADVVACQGLDTASTRTGTRIPLDQGSLAAQVQRTNAPARIDDYPYPAAGQGQSDLPAGFRASVGVPVTVGGRSWGMLSAYLTHGPLPSATEHRLALLAGTGAAAIAGAQARSDLLALADKQAALRRVAELAAHDAPVGEVLHVVAKEASVFTGVEFAMVLRYEDTDGGNQIVALDGAPDNFVVGMRAPGTGDGAVHRVWRTGRAARVENLGQAAGLWPGMAHARGFTSSAGVPIVIRGTLWGALIVVGGLKDFPATIEAELTHFAELAATAVSSTQARQQLTALADEQAALRRVAELAAHEAPAGQVLRAVAVETSALAGVDFTALLRYEPDGSTLIVALDGAPAGVAVGMRAPGTGDGAAQRVWTTGRPASIDNLGEMSGRWPQLAHRHGFNASVGVPIVMHGGLWGALVAVGRREAFSRSIEEHVSNFAELAGAAVSAADAREELKLLANEQAAVRRVAELVARGATLDEIFDAVTAETSSLLENLPISLLRYDEGEGTVVVAGNHNLTPTGRRYRGASDNDPLGDVRRTGRSVRVDNVSRVVATDPSSSPDIGIALPVTVEGQVWGALAVSTPGPPVPAGSEERLTPFAELAAVAIANAENKAKLTASRARVIATADETRRRVQRDVHDGAQQRLVHTIIALKLARDAVLAGEPPNDLLDEALTNAERASKELRDIVRGILPASLTRGGLRTGLESLLVDIALPVKLQVRVPRLTAHTETTAYFIVAEAMTNVVKHAQADRATVDVSINDGTLVIEVRDDGVGGADPRGGTGLTGLRDRVEAGNGTLTVTSPPGAGTVVNAALPLDHQPPPSPPVT
jgi:signal transduction histidine kinase